MVTGSIVSSLQGEPRASHDVDFVVALTPDKIPTLTAAFPPPEYYLDEVAMREAINRADMFNLLQVTTGDKVDFWMLTDEPFDRERFSRREAVHVLGLKMLYLRRRTRCYKSFAGPKCPAGAKSNSPTLCGSTRCNARDWTSRTSSRGRRD